MLNIPLEYLVEKSVLTINSSLSKLYISYVFSLDYDMDDTSNECKYIFPRWDN